MKNKTIIIGTIAAMLGGGYLKTKSPFPITPNPSSPKASNKPPRRKRHRNSEPSPYFGQRSKVVTAQTQKGAKQMKLKNALKGGFEFSF